MLSKFSLIHMHIMHPASAEDPLFYKALCDGP